MWTEPQPKGPTQTFHRLPEIGIVLCLAILSGATTQAHAVEATVASKRNQELNISLLRALSKPDSAEEYCVLFSRTKAGPPVRIERDEVFVDFAQQVGKIREHTHTFPFSRDGQGRYCGKVDLGTQYARPASYYVTVRYVDMAKRRKACRFFLTLN